MPLFNSVLDGEGTYDTNSDGTFGVVTEWLCLMQDKLILNFSHPRKRICCILQMMLFMYKFRIIMQVSLIKC